MRCILLICSLREGAQKRRIPPNFAHRKKQELEFLRTCQIRELSGRIILTVVHGGEGELAKETQNSMYINLAPKIAGSRLSVVPFFPTRVYTLCWSSLHFRVSAYPPLQAKMQFPHCWLVIEMSADNRSLSAYGLF